jgi:transcriptional regulator with XRE-family HTH domain
MQCRAARGLLDWTQDRLAEEAGVSALTIRNYEAGKTTPVPATLAVLRQAFESAGIEFIPEDDGGPGVRLRKAKPGRKMK